VITARAMTDSPDAFTSSHPKLEERHMDTSQYLTFTLAGEEYGVEILRVQEIKGNSTVTPIPNTPSYIKGVMNLRGTIIPVVDLRSKFGMDSTAASQFTVMIVLRVGAKVMALVVDAVSDVLNIAETEVHPTPDFGVRVDTRFIGGMAKAGEKLVMLLDIDTLLGADVMAGALN
jgi:purine-binding chemotaxis protein CheW